MSLQAAGKARKGLGRNMRIYKVILLNTGSEQFPLNQSGLSASVILYDGENFACFQ